jgi:hypothetical protein
MATNPQTRNGYVTGMKVLIEPNTNGRITFDDVSGTLETLAYSSALRKEDKYVRYAPASVVTTGGANTISIDLSNDYPAAYSENIPVRFKSPISNTGTVTLSISVIGFQTIYREDESALVTGDIITNSFYELVYNPNAGGSGVAGFTLYEGIGGSTTGSLAPVPIEITAATYTIAAVGTYVFTGSSACAVTLPAGDAAYYQASRFINAGTADCTFNDAGAETIIGSDPFVVYAGTAYEFLYTGITGKEWSFI